jgi:predicted RNA binding protein YcfA (HicA-like mRNA interferase family)
MGIKQIPTRLFIKYLKSLGLVYVRTKGDHDIWNYPDGHIRGKLIRPVIFRGKDKDIPVDHIATNLKTLGISNAQFEQAIKEM